MEVQRAMKLGVFAVLLSGMPLPEAARYFASLGIQGLEIGSGGYPGKAHCDPAALLADAGKLNEFKRILADNHLEIAALSCHGNPVHPDPVVAAGFQKDWDDTLKLAEVLRVDRVVTFSGCPGSGPGSRKPNWVTCAWPTDFADTLEYQWNDVLIPYWQRAARQAADHGVTKIALEMHPGFCVYNPDTLLRLRGAAGEGVGANFDPSHLFWQGIDIVAAVKYLGAAIQYVHAKDTAINREMTAINGVLDTGSYLNELGRSWIFRTVGYGHGYQEWKNIVSALRMTGYDGYLSIEHEDSLMSPAEGLKKAVAFMKDVMIHEDCRGDVWWA